jgi:rifampicin phosphotransferase
MPDLLSFDAIVAADTPRVGGKGASLSLAKRVGLPVPPGFVVTTDAYRRSCSSGIRSDAELSLLIREAYHELGGPVAVRSSATDEDGAETSFAGQQETILGVEGEEAVLDAIDQCWKSLHSARAIAYRRAQGIAHDSVAMAVVVQRLVQADTAGVLFTRDPQEPSANRMVVEASYGLGEVVVSGRVTPDRFTLDSLMGEIQERQLGRKTVRIVNGREEPVSDESQSRFCIGDEDLRRLWELGRDVEQYYGQPRDIEWAIADGRLFLLQSRPITSSGDIREQIRLGIVAGLKAESDPRGTVWVRYNLSEILPRPTPMTWAVVQRLLAADGGIGLMNRDLGGDPDPALGSQSAFDLVAGRPMVNLSRLPRLQFRRPPIEYPFARYKESPALALAPQPVANPLRDGCLVGMLRLPATIWRLWRIGSLAGKRAESFAEEFRTAIAPPFVAAARAELGKDYSAVEPKELLALFDDWTERTLVRFARESLKPTFFADASWSALVESLKPRLGDDRARTAVAELSFGAEPDADAHLAGALIELANGRIERDAFLARFGHRAAGEMELAVPRWSEDDAALRNLSPGSPKPRADGDAFDRIATEAKLAEPIRSRVRSHYEHLRTYLGLRETAKHDLLLGYAVIRKVLVELDRRFELNGGIFFLTPSELPRLIAGDNMRVFISSRRTRRRIELGFEVPPVLFSDDLEAIGRPISIPKGTVEFAGVPLSAGVAEGPALVLHEPSDAADVADGFVLVCPSTDPAWVPLFARASALVMETGGVLSHGAIVAREFALPATAGLPSITSQIRSGTRLRVDGGTGRVAILDGAS